MKAVADGAESKKRALTAQVATLEARVQVPLLPSSTPPPRFSLDLRVTRSESHAAGWCPERLMLLALLLLSSSSCRS